MAKQLKDRMTLEITIKTGSVWKYCQGRKDDGSLFGYWEKHKNGEVHRFDHAVYVSRGRAVEMKEAYDQISRPNRTRDVLMRILNTGLNEQYSGSDGIIVYFSETEQPDLKRSRSVVKRKVIDEDSGRPNNPEDSGVLDLLK